jgi:molecular chaperone DnaJ
MPRDPYEVLGISRDADETQVKKAAEAYEVLSDGERRATFDRYGWDGLRNGGYAPQDFSGFGSLGDIFDAFFGGGGGGRSGPMQGGDVGVTVEIDLLAAAQGVPVEVSYDAVARCEHCHGNGAEPGTPIETCPKCGGQGRLQAVQRTPFGQVMRTLECDVCHGDGRVAKEPCHVCDGRGREVKRRTLTVDIPAGIADGQRIRISGNGHEGERGGPAGDLYVQIHVTEHERFVRDGDDLVTILDLPAPLAALGTHVRVPLLEGEEDVEIPEGTQPGATIVLRGKGMPPLRRGRSGDLRVVVNVVIPRKLSKRQKELLHELSDSITPENLSSDESVFSKLRRSLFAT